MANLMQGTRAFHFYLYGPIYNIGPVWAEDQETLLQIGQMMRQIARCEDDLLAAKNRPCDAAVLVANSAECNAPFYRYPFDKERLTALAALADSQYPVEIVGEEEILADDALARYRVLYVCDPHVQARVQEKIKAWVAAGGVVWASYAGAARTEFDEPSTSLDEVFGLKSRGPLEPFAHAGYGCVLLPPGPGVKIPASESFRPDRIAGTYQGGSGEDQHGLYLYADYELASGKAVAAFDDGRPAIMHNRFGKGEALLCGFVAGLSYGSYFPGHFAHIPSGPNATALRAQLWTAAAQRANVRRHAWFDDCFGVQTAVHDGPRQTVVFVQNQSGQPLAAKTLTVAVERPIVSAYSSTGVDVPYEQAAGTAQVPVTLEQGAGVILVFRHE